MFFQLENWQSCDGLEGIMLMSEWKRELPIMCNDVCLKQSYPWQLQTTMNCGLHMLQHYETQAYRHLPYCFTLTPLFGFALYTDVAQTPVHIVTSLSVCCVWRPHISHIPATGWKTIRGNLFRVWFVFRWVYEWQVGLSMYDECAF